MSPTKAVPPSAEVRGEALNRARALSADLYPHQVEGLAFLLARRGAILADDMGLGKTRQGVLAMAEAQPEGPYLVVCPASVKLNWKREIELARPDAEVWVVGEAPPSNWKGWIVLNYDILRRHIEWLRAMPLTGLIFDEAHYLKNHRSQRSILSRSLVDQEARPLTYLLTGTPLTNRPRDLFPLLQLIRHPLGTSFLSFAKRYCDAARNDYGWVTDGASNLDELALQLKGVLLRRKKEDVLDLPPKVRTFLDVELPESTALKETRAVLELLLGLSITGGGGDQDRTGLLSRLTKARHTLAKAKAKATLDFVSGAVAQGDKVIVFSGFDAPLQKIAKHLGDKCVLLTGKTPAKKRQALVDRFQEDPEVRVFAANVIAGGVGLNLTAARQVVFNDLDWVPANHWQAEDRAYRIGQTGSVHVSYMVAPNTLDEFVKRVLEIKTALVESVVDGKILEGEHSKSALEELQRLVRSISPGLADSSVDRRDPAWIQKLLRETVNAYRAENPSVEGEGEGKGESSTQTVSDAELIEMLARVLGGPTDEVYRIASGSQAGKSYTLNAIGADVSCTCPGFEYRGMCRHARTLKEALVAGEELPEGYLREGSPESRS